jgi:hypothetical protein
VDVEIVAREVEVMELVLVTGIVTVTILVEVGAVAVEDTVRVLILRQEHAELIRLAGVPADTQAGVEIARFANLGLNETKGVSVEAIVKMYAPSVVVTVVEVPMVVVKVLEAVRLVLFIEVAEVVMVTVLTGVTVLTTVVFVPRLR